VHRLEQCAKSFNRETGVANDAASRASCQLGVMRNGESPVRKIGLSQDDMTSGLVIHQIANLLQCANRGLT